MMQHRFALINFNIFIFFLAVFSLLFSAYQYDEPATSFIKLKNERLPVTPTEFYIAGIADVRTDKTTIGSLLPVLNVTGKQADQLKVDLKGGINGLRAFIDYGLPADKALRPVIISLRSFRVTESMLPGGKVNGLVTLSVSFELQQGDDLVHLTDYTGNASYQRNTGPAQQIEPLLRSTIANSLVFLNNWMNSQAGTNIKLAKGVKTIFEDFTEPLEGDTIYYSANRPLKWTDFKQRPILTSSHGAEIFASLGYNENVEVVNSIITIKLQLKVYAPKSACWVRGDVNDAYSLNHEQRHFDIVKLISEHFKQTVKGLKLTAGNYDGPINVAYFDALREMDQLQKQYDGETRHSVNSGQQRVWNERIDNELQQSGVKPDPI